MYSNTREGKQWKTKSQKQPLGTVEKEISHWCSSSWHLFSHSCYKVGHCARVVKQPPMPFSNSQGRSFVSHKLCWLSTSTDIVCCLSSNNRSLSFASLLWQQSPRTHHALWNRAVQVFFSRMLLNFRAGALFFFFQTTSRMLIDSRTSYSHPNK